MFASGDSIAYGVREGVHGLDFPIYILITYRDILILLKELLLLIMSLNRYSVLSQIYTIIVTRVDTLVWSQSTQEDLPHVFLQRNEANDYQMICRPAY